ncbi:MAG: hypothetical protein O3C13_06340 [Bacteroidetes bacterium]|nr:hypothetical protein [Bacteroidota bacterium]
MIKKVLISGIIGTVVYYLLGWLVYGFLLPERTSGEESMLFIFLGCLFYAFIFAYIFCKLVPKTNFKSGFISGLILGGLLALSMYFFYNLSGEFNIVSIIEELIIGGMMIAFMNGAITYVISKTNDA